MALFAFVYALINAFYNMSVDTYKIFSLAASKFKDQLYFQKGITQDQDIFRFVKYLSTFFYTY
jgi:hypothetical protein